MECGDQDRVSILISCLFDNSRHPEKAFVFLIKPALVYMLSFRFGSITENLCNRAVIIRMEYFFKALSFWRVIQRILRVVKKPESLLV